MEAEDWGRTAVHSGEIMAYDDVSGMRTEDWEIFPPGKVLHWITYNLTMSLRSDSWPNNS